MVKHITNMNKHITNGLGVNDDKKNLSLHTIHTLKRCTK